MAEKFVRDLPPLTETEESTALIPVSALGDMDVTHKLDIAGLVDAQQRVSPIPSQTNRTLLASYTSSNRATAENLLNYQENQRRHAFDDGYNYLVVITFANPDFISQHVDISQWNASNQSNPIRLRGLNTADALDVWKISEQGFGIVGQDSGAYLKDIYGYRILPQMPQPAERLDLHFQSTPRYNVVYNRNLSVTLPPASGGTPPYTYAISGAGTFDPVTRRYSRGNITSSYSFSYTVTDDNNDTETVTIAVDVGTQLMLPRAAQSDYTPSWSGGRPEIPFSVTLPQATGGTPPYLHSVRLFYDDGSGLSFGSIYGSFNSTTRVLQATYAGRLESGDTFGFYHDVEDASGQTVRNTYSWVR